MNSFRQAFVARVLALSLLGGLGAWITAPLATAHSGSMAAQLARAHAAGPIESAVAEALAVAARSEDGPAAFHRALQAALEAHPEGAVLAEFLEAGESPADLLDMLVGALLQSKRLSSPLFVAAMATPVAQSGTAGPRALVVSCDGLSAPRSGSVALLPGDDPEVVVSVRELSAAQPLGP